MVDEIKQVLSQFDNVDQYAGYQIVADLWESSLEEDAELIAANGFYESGRTRKPNMVEKGSGAKKRTVQDGWLGAIVPNDLIADVLYQDDKAKISELEQKAADVESELGELVEAAKTEATPEYDALFDMLKKMMTMNHKIHLKAKGKGCFERKRRGQRWDWLLKAGK